MRIKELDWSAVPDHAVLLFLGRRKSGKTTAILDTLYRKRNSITMGLVFCGSKATAAQYAQVIPSTFIYPEYRPDVFKRVIDTQERSVEMGGDVKTVVVIMDDLGFAAKSFVNDPSIRFAAQNGRHIRLLFIFSLQYALDVPPNIRQQVDVTFLCREANPNNRQRIFEHYNPCFRSFDEFDRAMVECTKNFEIFCLLSHNDSDQPENNVAFYRALPDRRFRVNAHGSWWQFHRRRFDPQYLLREDEGVVDLGKKTSRGSKKANAPPAQIIKVPHPVSRPSERPKSRTPAQPDSSPAVNSELHNSFMMHSAPQTRHEHPERRRQAVSAAVAFSRPPATTQTPLGAEWLRKQRQENLGPRRGGFSSVGGTPTTPSVAAVAPRVREVASNVRFA